MAEAFRAKWMNPDLRRHPLRHPYCSICGRALTPGQPHRYVLYELDRYEAVHAGDWDAARCDILARRNVVGEPLLVEPIGMDCARRLGFEWSLTGEKLPDWALAEIYEPPKEKDQ